MGNPGEWNGNGRNPEERARALQEAITRRAGELYQQRGCVDGHALEDWLQAEAEVTAQFRSQENASEEKPASESSSDAEKPKPPALDAPVSRKSGFFKLKVDDVIYTVEYDPARCDSYRPGMLRKGQPVELRFEDDRIFMKLPNSRELEAKVVKKGQA